MHRTSENYCDHTALSGRNGDLVKKKKELCDERTLLMFTGVSQHRSYGAQGHHVVQADFSQKGCFLPFRLFIFFLSGLYF